LFSNYETQVTDKGLAHLKRMTKTTLLRLDHTAITDAGLEHLRHLTKLHNLTLGHTRVTTAGIARLKRTIPAIHIVLND
jgi:hypothetical protein